MGDGPFEVSNRMKLLRFGDVGRERPGIVDSESQIRDLSPIMNDLGDNVLLPESLEKLRELDLHSPPSSRMACESVHVSQAWGNLSALG
jgi:hypothetical protein